ncbi:MAG: class I SAM-dependent methyltransferase [Bauldia sp.]
MSPTISLAGPPTTAKYIALQRTHLQPKAARLARRLFGKRLFDRSLLPYFLSADQILASYSDEIRAEYQELATWLPPKAANILDIGCGLAGIDVFLFAHYSVNSPHIYLMDKTRTDEAIHYGHEKVASFYNDLALAQQLLTRNGVPAANIHPVEAEQGAIARLPARFDLILSLLSWGFHYDLVTYLDEALRALAPGGAIIIDVRKDSPSFTELSDRFGTRYDIIADFSKHRRIRIAPS